jgi:hypothetical protein
MRRLQAGLVLALVSIISPSATAAEKATPPGQSAPINTELPSIIGDPLSGKTLTASAGVWAGPAQTYAHQWQRCNADGSACAPVSNSTTTSFVLGDADVGGTIRVVVTATNKNGSTIATSDAIGVVASSSLATGGGGGGGGGTGPGESTIGTTDITTTTTTTTTTPTTPTTPPLFVGDWETGDISQWTWGAQCHNTGETDAYYATRGNLYVVADTPAQGRYAGRFDLPADTTTSTSCEVLRKRTLALGTDDWYGMEVYFPSNWQEPSSAFWGMAIAQFNYQALTGPPVGLFAHRDHVNLVVWSGRCVYGGYCQYRTGNDDDTQGTFGHALRIVPVGSLTPGWQQFVVHVRWAKDSSGLVEGWWRPRGGSWTKTVTWSGYPTVQWTDTHPADTNDTTSDKIGAYRGAASFPITIHHDAFCVATSFGAAAGCL